MNQEVRDFVVEKSKELIAAPTCCGELREAARAWLAAAGTEKEAAETEKYLAELEADIVTVDGLIAFAESEGGKKVFGEEKAKEVAAHAREIKGQGALYCDCPACAAVEAILAKKEQMTA